MEGLKRKLEGEIEIRVGSGEAFHEILVNKPSHVSIVSPTFVQGCDLHDGAFGNPGSIICWNYTLDGREGLSSKQIVEVIDEENKIIKFKVMEGDLLDEFKTFLITYQVISTGEETSTVKWIFEYEKRRVGIPDPSSLMDAMLSAAKDIDEHHHQPK